VVQLLPNCQGLNLGHAILLEALHVSHASRTEDLAGAKVVHLEHLHTLASEAMILVVHSFPANPLGVALAILRVGEEHLDHLDPASPLVEHHALSHHLPLCDDACYGCGCHACACHRSHRHADDGDVASLRLPQAPGSAAIP